jgi:hypothetical protein
MPLRARTRRRGSGQTAPYWGLSSECVVVVVGNYGLQLWIYETRCRLGMHIGFCNRRRIQITPETSLAWRLHLRKTPRPIFTSHRPPLLRWGIETPFYYGLSDALTAVMPEVRGNHDACRTRRCFCRCQSRFFSVSRLSCSFLPRASAISHFTRCCFQYMAVHTAV